MKNLFTLIVILVLASSAFTQNLDTIDWMLELHEKLNLSKDDGRELMKIKSDLKKFFVRKDADIKISEIELKELMRNKEKNLNQIKSAYNDLAFLGSAKNYAEVEAEVKALKILNEEQKKELFTAIEQWHHKQIQKKKIVTHKVGGRDLEDEHVIIKKRIESTVLELKEEIMHELGEQIDMHEGLAETEELKHSVRRIAELVQRIRKLDQELEKERAKKK